MFTVCVRGGGERGREGDGGAMGAGGGGGDGHIKFTYVAYSEQTLPWHLMTLSSTLVMSLSLLLQY